LAQAMLAQEELKRTPVSMALHGNFVGEAGETVSRLCPTVSRLCPLLAVSEHRRKLQPSNGSVATCMTALMPNAEASDAGERCRDTSVPLKLKPADFLALTGAGGLLLHGVAAFAGLRASRLCAASHSSMYAELAFGLSGLFRPALCIVGGQETEFGGEEDDDGIYVPSTWACSACSLLDPSSATWRSLPPMPTARSRCAAASAGSILYVLGGDINVGRGASPCDAFESLDLEAGTWRQLPGLPTPTSRFVATYLRGKIVIAGGECGGSCTSAVAAYDLAERTWESLPHMPTARCGSAAAEINGQWYVVGGSNGKQPVADLQRWSLPGSSSSGWWGDGVWETLPDMPTPREDCAAAATGGCLIVAAGTIQSEPCSSCCMTDIVECFDTSVSVWSTLVSMPKRREGAVAGAVNSQVFVLGGISWWEDSKLGEDALEGSAVVLDLSEDRSQGALEWATAPQLLDCVVGLAAAVVATA